MVEKVKPEILAVKDKLFKPTAYDIRAYVGEMGDFFSDKAVLTPESMRVAGVLMGSVAFTSHEGQVFQLMPGDAVVVGYDNGPTSQILAEAFSLGLMEQGIDVYDVGVASSGQVYHNQAQLGARGYVQITRSHVEVSTNGAKFGIDGQGVHTYFLGQMNEALSQPTIGRQAAPGLITDKKEEGYRLYAEKMIVRYGEYFKKHKRKVAVNLFGGTGLKYKDLFRTVFGEEVVILGDTVNVNDGTLLADPTRREMLEMVPDLHKTLDAGVRIHSFDLDADRGSLTEGKRTSGLTLTEHYLGDDLAYIITDYSLSVGVAKLFAALCSFDIPRESADELHRLAATTYVDPRYSSGIRSFVNSKGGSTVYHRKGHSLWKETMTANMNTMARLAGFDNVQEFARFTHYQNIQIEASLHLFATDPEDGVPRDDAIENVFLLEKILDALSISSLHEYFADIPRRFATKEIRTNSVSNEVKEAVTYGVMDIIRTKFTGPDYSLVEFDGQIRADWDTGFIMYGMSNTSPKLTFMAEGSTVQERNSALAYMLALHNTIKTAHGDKLPMDTKENPFFIDDAGYEMEDPDKVDMNEERVKLFMQKRHIG